MLPNSSASAGPFVTGTEFRAGNRERESTTRTAVIPAKAGIQGVKRSGRRSNSHRWSMAAWFSARRMKLRHPAEPLDPAFAGMTKGGMDWRPSQTLRIPFPTSKSQKYLQNQNNLPKSSPFIRHHLPCLTERRRPGFPIRGANERPPVPRDLSIAPVTPQMQKPINLNITGRYRDEAYGKRPGAPTLRSW